MNDFFSRNFKREANDEPEDDDDKIIIKSKKEVEYAARFIDFDARDAFEAALK